MTEDGIGRNIPTYIDRPEVTEIFADHLQSMHFDGGNLRMEFSVVRLDSLSRGDERKAWAYPTCRLVLPARGAFDMLKRMNDLQKALVNQGVLPETESSS